MTRFPLLTFLFMVASLLCSHAADPVRPIIRVNGEAGTTFSFTDVPSVQVSIQNMFVGGGSVFYTLDGSAPTAASLLYTNAFTVDRSATIRAIAYSPSFETAEADAVEVELRGAVFLRTRAFGYGQVTVASPGVDGTSLRGPVFNLGETVILTGIPDENFRFVRWTDGNTDNPRALRMISNTLAAAVFEPKQEFEEQIYKDWDVSFGGSFEDTVASMVPTGDGGTIVAATSFSRPSGNKTAPRHGSSDVWLIKIDSAGEKVWERSYGGTHIERVVEIIAKGDGTYYVAAESSSTPSGNKASPLRDAGFKDYWILQIDENGEKIWEESYGGDGTDGIGGIVLAPDGGFIIVGQSTSTVSGNKSVLPAGGWDVWALQVNTNRSVVWQRTFGGAGSELGPRIAEFPSGNEYLLVAGGMSHTRFRTDQSAVTVGAIALVTADRMLTMESDSYLVAERLGLAGVYSNALQPTWNSGTWGFALRARDGAYLFGRHGRHLIRTENDGSRAVNIVSYDSADPSTFVAATRTEHGYLFGLQSSAQTNTLKRAALHGESDVWLAHFRSIILPKGAPRILVDGVAQLTNRLSAASAEITLSSQARRRIFYTLNGNTPTTNSASYSTPLRVSSDAVVRAAADFGNGVLVEGPQVTVTFVGRSFLELQQTSGGVISASPEQTSYPTGTEILVTATPNPGWAFLRWDGDISGKSATQHIVMNSNKVARAVFGTPLTLNKVGAGTIETIPSENLWPLNSELELVAIPDPGHYFAVWGATATGNINPLPLKVTEPRREVSALFLPLATNDVALTVVPRGSGAVDVSPRANVYTRGAIVTLTATPKAGAAFVQWEGGINGTNASVTVTLDDSKLIFARFNDALPPETNVVVQLQNARVDGASLRFDIITETVGEFELQTSVDLQEWTAVRNITTTGAVISVTEATTNAVRFYRLKKR